MPLPQQSAARTPQRLSLRLPLPQQLARVTPQRPEQRSEVPEHRHNDHEAQKQGGDTMTAGNERKSSVPVFNAPRFPAALPAVRSNSVSLLPHTTLSPCSLQPSRSSETVPRARAPPPTTSTHPAHEPPASMSWSAPRLRQERFDEPQRGNTHLAGDLRTGGRSPHFFEIGEKCEKKNFKRLICKARQ